MSETGNSRWCYCPSTVAKSIVHDTPPDVVLAALHTCGLTWLERASLVVQQPERFTHTEAGDARLAAWDARLPGPLSQRLHWDGLTPTQARLACGHIDVAGLPCPRWLDLLQSVLNQSGSHNVSTLPAWMGSGETIPFAHWMVPYVEEALRRLSLNVADLAEAAPGVTTGPRMALLRDIARPVGRVLYPRFARFRMAATAAAEATGSTKPDLYVPFVQSCSGDRLGSFLMEVPSLARYIATRCVFWIDAMTRVHEHLETFEGEVAAMLGLDRLPPVKRIRGDLAGSTSLGRGVCCIEFEGGCRILHKDKPMGLAAGLAEVQAWVNERAGTELMRSVGVKDHGDWGWMHYVNRTHPQSAHETDEVAIRMGGLLCLIDILQGSDCHRSNVRIDSGWPYLIVSESLAVPSRAAPPSSGQGDAPEVRWFDRGVAACGFLPRWRRTMSGGRIDDTGCSILFKERRPVRAKRLLDINTDTMRLVRVENDPESQSDARPGPDMPRIGEHLAKGYSTIYAVLEANRDALLADDGPLGRIRTGQVRGMFRAAMGYRALQKRSFDGSLAGDVLDRSLSFDRIGVHLLAHQGDQAPSGWHRHAAEVQSMTDGDYPHFHVRADSTDLFFRGACIERHWYHASGGEVLRARVNRMCDADRAMQVGVIRDSIASHESVDPFGSLHARCVAAARVPRPDVSDESIRDAGLRLCDRLWNAKISSDTGACRWIGPATFFGNCRRVTVLREDLPDGMAGIVLALAAAAAVDPTPLRQQRANAITASWIDMLPCTLGASHQPGWGGLGGWLTTMGMLMQLGVRDDDGVAGRLVSMAGDVCQDGAHDVATGLSGLIGGLCMMPGDHVAEMLASLVDCLEPASGRSGWWLGQAGTAWALAMAAARLGRTDLGARAAECWNADVRHGRTENTPTPWGGSLCCGPASLRWTGRLVSQLAQVDLDWRAIDEQSGVSLVTHDLAEGLAGQAMAWHECGDFSRASTAAATIGDDLNGLRQGRDWPPDRLVPGWLHGTAGIAWTLLAIARSSDRRLPGVLGGANLG